MIRLALKKDIDEIIELGILIDSNFEKLFDINAILKDQVSKIYVYEEESKVVGFLHISKLYETIDIINIAVDPNYRNKKIGSNLLDYMISDTLNDIKKFILEVNVSNKAAFNLYKKFGFKVINTRKNYYQNEDAYLMVKEV